MSSDIDWPAVIKKEARGLNGEDLGKVEHRKRHIYNN